MSLKERLKAKASQLGFGLVGVTTPAQPETYGAFRAWLAAGYAGEMRYLEQQAEARAAAAAVLPDVRSVVMLALNYRQPAAPAAEGSGKIAAYAQGADYHRVLWDKLDELLHWVQAEAPGCVGRGIVDTAPLLERDFARRAGLGWFGKNTMLIHPRLGSFFFLGALLLSLPLEPDPPFASAHCGTCTACLDACPTAAFPQPGVLDATKCVSYLTIELKGPIPQPLRAGLEGWIFGCDVCQDVCPWNRKAPLGVEPALAPRPDLRAPELIALLRLTPEEFRRRFKETALWRARRRGLLRNVCIALGNLRRAEAVPALTEALQDEEPLIREAAAWALERIGEGQAEAPSSA